MKVGIKSVRYNHYRVSHLLSVDISDYEIGRMKIMFQQQKRKQQLVSAYYFIHFIILWDRTIE